MANKNEEDIIQAECVKWYTNNYCLDFHEPQGVIFSVPNGGERNKVEAMKLKATGLLAGVSDLIVILPTKEILFIEMKKHDGRQDTEQIKFQNKIEKLGYKYLLIRSLKQFQDEITSSLPPTHKI